MNRRERDAHHKQIWDQIIRPVLHAKTSRRGFLTRVASTTAAAVVAAPLLPDTLHPKMTPAEGFHELLTKPKIIDTYGHPVMHTTSMITYSHQQAVDSAAD